MAVLTFVTWFREANSYMHSEAREGQENLQAVRAQYRTGSLLLTQQTSTCMLPESCMIVKSSLHRLMSILCSTCGSGRKQAWSHS